MRGVQRSIAATSTRAMVAAAESRGVDTGDLLVRFGIDRALAEDRDAYIPALTVMALWDALRERSGDPTLQLSAPGILPFGANRVIDYLICASPTIGEGIIRFARFFGLIARGVRLGIEADGDERRLHIRLVDGGRVPGVYVDYVFAALVGRIRTMIDPSFRVRRVELRHGAPPDPSPYAACFLAPVTFDAPADLLCFDLEAWDAPIPQADMVLLSVLEEHARMLLPAGLEPADAFVASVRMVVARALPEDVSAETAARTLHVSVRTMQRKLVAAGTTFRDVADAVREDLAEVYLVDPNMSITEVALLLGFGDQTSFTRAFRRWTGESPGAWRRRRTAVVAS